MGNRLSHSLASKAFNWFVRAQETSCSAGFGHALPGSLHGVHRESLNCSIVMACVHWASRNVGQATPVVQRRTGTQWTTDPGHPLEHILRHPQCRLPHHERTGMDGRKLLSALVVSRMLDGNAYALKLRDAEGRLVGLDWMPHSAVTPVARQDRPSVVDHYAVQTPEGTVEISPADVVHDRDGTDPDNPIRGFNRLRSISRHILTDNQIADYLQAVLKSPTPSLMVTAKGDSVRISQQDAEYLAKKIRESTSGAKAGSVIVPTFPAEIEPVGFSPEQMAVNSLQRLPEERITAVFGIPAMVLGLGAGADRATYANMREAREAAAEEFLVPLWQDLAATFSEQLLGEFDSLEETRVWFDTSEVGVLQEDRDRLHERVRADVAAGLIDTMQARELLA